MRRITAVLSVLALMLAMMAAMAMPAVASSNQFPHTCVDLSGGTLCQHRVFTPSGTSNGQDHLRDDTFAHEGGAEVGGQVVPGEYVSHSTIAPSGNFNTMLHQNLEQ
jgi:hypothetical protein